MSMTLSRRDLIVNWATLTLLRWRVVRGSALPLLAGSLLRSFDALALRHAERAVDAPFDPAKSAALDKALSTWERDR